MVVVDQSFLIFVGMVQHFASNRMLYIEEVVHEVHGTGRRIRALHKILKFLFSECFFAVRCFDQYGVKSVFCANHLVLFLLIFRGPWARHAYDLLHNQHLP